MTYIAARTDGASGAPLLLTFHGTGSDEHQFHALGQQLLPNAHVVSPRGDVREGPMNRFFRRTGEGVYDMEDLAQRTTTMGEFIAGERERTRTSRTIGFGYSNGANILASVAFSRPELVDEMILMHPLIPWQPAPTSGLSGRRVLITAGRRDPICPAPETERLIAYFRDQGSDVTEVWHEGGHEIRQDELTAAQNFLT